jgi:hypothetical protein
MKYTLKSDETLTFNITKVEEDTIVNSLAYGEILITKGNYIVEPENEEEKVFGTTETDLNLYYEKIEEENLGGIE